MKVEEGFIPENLNGVLNDVIMMSLESLDIPCTIALRTILFL